ncbi:NAD-dependent succinate-semialdehyde dehydrogenase [Gymnodinialimonas sp. 2305UL16-5]|uniref:NAD-dependent succinate-semialdehyde dehydrogenase n=1 Tax=Gymnodinialimonas mytili TaxID=3126503 RepID=UPI0030A9CFEB
MQTPNSTDLLIERCLVNGDWLGASSGNVIDVLDPATGEVIGTVPDFGAEDTELTVEAAASAFPAWRDLTAAQRAKVLRRWFDLLIEHKSALAAIMTREQGKPLSEAEGEIVYAASFVEWFAEEAKRTYGETIPAPVPGRRIIVEKEPVGVVAAITPWNFPAAMITRKAAPALAAGCTVVVKPSELTPFTALAIAKLGMDAGLPPGTLNVVTGQPKAIGSVLTGSSKVRKLSFTGSTAVGKTLMAECAPTLKKVSLELGGNAPFIVFDDADLDSALEGVMASKFRNGGQTCVCANRIYVQATVLDEFASRLAEKVSGLQVGPGMDATSEIGPMINTSALEKIEAHVADAASLGAVIATGDGKRHADGQFIDPVVLTGATEKMRLASEETFGPVAALFPFETEAEVIERANGTPYGLAAYLYTRDLGRSMRVGRALEAGMVGLNVGAFATEVAPFGGVKESGLGREGARQGIDEFLEEKTYHVEGL